MPAAVLLGLQKAEEDNGIGERKIPVFKSVGPPLWSGLKYLN